MAGHERPHLQVTCSLCAKRWTWSSTFLSSYSTASLWVWVTWAFSPRRLGRQVRRNLHTYKISSSLALARLHQTNKQINQKKRRLASHLSQKNVFLDSLQRKIHQQTLKVSANNFSPNSPCPGSSYTFDSKPCFSSLSCLVRPASHPHETVHTRASTR